MSEPYYKKIWYCHTCQKYIAEEYAPNHKKFDHKVEGYVSMPANVPKYEKGGKNDVVSENRGQ